MDSLDYQREIMRTINFELSTEDLGIMALLGLAGETGEVLEMVKKELYHGHDLSVGKLAAELGDVLYYLALLANVFNMRLSDLMAMNIAKLQERYPHGFSKEASQNRKEPKHCTAQGCNDLAPFPTLSKNINYAYTDLPLCFRHAARCEVVNCDDIATTSDNGYLFCESHKDNDAT